MEKKNVSVVDNHSGSNVFQIFPDLI